MLAGILKYTFNALRITLEAWRFKCNIKNLISLAYY